MRLTVGPLPPAVYWRRRAIVLSGVLLALFLVAQACMSASASPERRSSNEPSDSPSPSRPVERTTPPAEQPPGTRAATPTAGPSTAPTATPPDPDACTDDEMLITAEAEQTEFAGGTSVQLTIRIRNDSERTCRRDIGGDLRELYLRAGEGASKVWSSRDCGAPRGTAVQELTPGFEQEHWVVWSGRGSDSCDGDDPAGELVPPGEYELIARLGTAYSEPLAITIVGPVE